MLKAVGQALFSTGLQSPKFTEQEKKGPDYEIRTYHATKWVSTSLSAMQWDTAMNTGFRRLFNYIQGNNHNSPDMSTPSEAAPRGWGSGRCQSLKRAFYWLLFLPPTLVTTIEFSSPVSVGRSLLFNFCSLQIKCH
eukprot:superscaffoldBa00001727_g11774